MDLSEYLAVPYLLEAEAVEYEPDRWIIRLTYPELPDCTADAAVVEDALRELEKKRIEIIVGLVRAGAKPPVPRKPLAASNPLWIARNLNLPEDITDMLAAPRQ